MEPVDPPPLDGALPAPSLGPGSQRATTATPTDARAEPGGGRLVPMLPWRVAGAVALAVALGAVGWQIWRVVDGRQWSDRLHLGAIVAAAVTAVCVLVWTGIVAANARRLVGPAATRELPDPRVAVLTWLPSMALVAVAIGVVTVAGGRDLAADDASPVPLVLAVVALLVAIPLAHRPLSHLAGVVRQIGGQGIRVAAWMWLPTLLSVIGIASVVLLRVAGADDADATGGAGSDWGPLWVVGVAAAVPAAVLVVVAWRAAATVEEAVVVAHRRQTRSPRATGRVTRAREHPVADVVNRDRVDLMGGAETLRLAIVTFIAGLALLLLVAAGVMFLFSRHDGTGLLLPAERQQAADALDVLRRLGSVVCVALVVAAAAWSFVAVLDVRRASARRRNPVIAAVAWPVSAVLVWMLADTLVVGEPGGTRLLGFATQAVALLLPFLCLERAAAAVDAPRAALRLTYLATVGLVVAVQLVIPEATLDDGLRTGEDLMRIAGLFGFGATLFLVSTLAVTQACRAIEEATDRMVAAHNVLVEQREAIEQRASGRSGAPTMVPVMPVPIGGVDDGAATGV